MTFDGGLLSGEFDTPVLHENCTITTVRQSPQLTRNTFGLSFSVRERTPHRGQQSRCKEVCFVGS